MLQEIENVRQHPKDLKRRWFHDEFFDLIVWYDDDDQFFGFQLCYDKFYHERALTWTLENGFTHNRVDDGKETMLGWGTPILVSDGLFPAEDIIFRFEAESIEMDADVREFVLNKLYELNADFLE